MTEYVIYPILTFVKKMIFKYRFSVSVRKISVSKFVSACRRSELLGENHPGISRKWSQREQKIQQCVI